MADKFLDVETVRRRLGISKATTYRLLKSKELPYVKVGPKCAFRILESHLLKFLQQRATHEA